MTDHLLLDVSSLLYRAFHALPSSIRDDAGRPVGAVRGYLDMVARVRADRRPDVLVHVLDDAERPAARVAAWLGYKAERPQPPPELLAQFALLRELLAAAGEQVAYAAGWEADDAIAALVASADAADHVEVLTGDRDLLQLVDDGGPVVRVLFTERGVSQLKVYDEGAVLERHGVPPARYADYAALRGDPSDGLPGVRGVGERTARDLVTRFGDLDGVLAAADGLSARLGQRLTEASGYLAAMREVVPVRRDVALIVEDGPGDDDALATLAAERRLEGALARFLEARA
ncbi:MAG: 5'-3' exonuclease H3TH domain-containing protein [Egibacteraceae bacterium]